MIYIVLRAIHDACIALKNILHYHLTITAPRPGMAPGSGDVQGLRQVDFTLLEVIILWE